MYADMSVHTAESRVKPLKSNGIKGGLCLFVSLCSSVCLNTVVGTFCLSVTLSVCVCLFVCLFVCPSVYPFVGRPACLSVFLSHCLFA